MNTDTLIAVEAELTRFKERLNACWKKSDENLGWKSYTDDQIVGVGEFSRTKEAGALRRASLDLKRVLTDNLS